MPVWWEFANLLNTEGEDDAEWKDLLREYMKDQGKGHEVGEWFWQACYQLRRYPDLSENGKETLTEIRKAAGLENEEAGAP